MNWNKRLKAARERRGMTKSDFAKAVGVSAPTVTDWESGEIKKIDGENLLRACRVLATDPSWIMFGEENEEALKEANLLAAAILRIKDAAQREAITTQLRAFGVLDN